MDVGHKLSGALPGVCCVLNEFGPCLDMLDFKEQSHLLFTHTSRVEIALETFGSLPEISLVIS